MKHILVILVLVASISACGTEILPKNEAISHEKNMAFSINFPTANWKLVNQQGIDSYVGYYENGAEKIYFDHGWYSDATIRGKAEYYQEVKLKKCGCNAVIAKDKMGDGRIMLFALVFKEGKKDRTKLYVLDPEDDEKFIKIFKTYTFK